MLSSHFMGEAKRLPPVWILTSVHAWGTQTMTKVLVCDIGFWISPREWSPHHRLPEPNAETAETGVEFVDLSGNIDVAITISLHDIHAM